MTFMELAQARFSVRQFDSRPVEQEKLDKILEAARIAPTAKNQQPQRIYVLKSEEALRKMKEISPCVYGAPVVLLFTYSKDEEWHNPLEEGPVSGVQDASIAAVHAMMEAQELGLGSVWCNYFPNSEAERVFNIPASERAVLFMPVGYAAEGCRPAPAHAASKPLADMVKYL